MATQSQESPVKHMQHTHDQTRNLMFRCLILTQHITHTSTYYTETGVKWVNAKECVMCQSLIVGMLLTALMHYLRVSRDICKL